MLNRSKSVFVGRSASMAADMAELRARRAAAGRKGGRSRSAKKAAAARANGRLGGSPKGKRPRLCTHLAHKRFGIVRVLGAKVTGSGNTALVVRDDDGRDRTILVSGPQWDWTNPSAAARTLAEFLRRQK